MNDKSRRMVGWVSLLAAPLGLFNVYCYMVAVNGDTEGMFKPAVALAMSASAQHWFQIGELADSFSFYLPFLLIGGYLWSQLRSSGQALLDIGMFAICIYVVLGIAGTSMQMAALPALSAVHASGDAMAKVASENAWLAVVTATERGLWWMEGPLMSFWALVTGAALLRSGRSGGRGLMATGVLYAVIFVCEFVHAGPQVENVLLTILTLLVPIWLVMFGWGLLRGKTSANDAQAQAAIVAQ